MVEKATGRGLIDSLVVEEENTEKNTSGRLVEGTNVREYCSIGLESIFDVVDVIVHSIVGEEYVVDLGYRIIAFEARYILFK